jgi:hypothetical protein
MDLTLERVRYSGDPEVQDEFRRLWVEFKRQFTLISYSAFRRMVDEVALALITEGTVLPKAEMIQGLSRGQEGTLRNVPGEDEFDQCADGTPAEAGWKGRLNAGRVRKPPRPAADELRRKSLARRKLRQLGMAVLTWGGTRADRGVPEWAPELSAPAARSGWPAPAESKERLFSLSILPNMSLRDSL